jgi:hypothetical protein
MRSVTLALALLLLPSAAGAQARRLEVAHTEQTVGSWLLSCKTDPMIDAQVCRMRHRLWLVVPDETRPGIALEVAARSAHLVPMITARELSLSTAVTGLMALAATAQVRFEGAPMAELPCWLDGAAVICAPDEADAGRSPCSWPTRRRC